MKSKSRRGVVGDRFAAILLVCSAFLPLPAAAERASGEAVSWRANPTVVPVPEEKRFLSGTAHLTGTLYLPPTGRKFATVVVFHGASSPLRTSPLYAHLIEMLPSIGMAVFVFDRRGAGASEGDRGSASFENLADDGIAAIDMLRRDPRLDPDRIGVWGLSQGGWLAMIAAARSTHVAFAVAISAPVVTPDVQMMFSSTNSLRVFGYSDAAIAQMRATRAAVDGYMRGRIDHAAAQRAVDAAKTQPWFRYLYIGETVGDRETSGWRREIEHDPLQALDRISVPLLILYGATDPVVPVATSVDRLAAVARRHPKMQVAVIANADHGMQIGVDPRTLLDPDRADEERPNAPEYFAVLTNWLARRLSPPRR